jgi:predicted ArsR family transcriptional regulator
MNNKKQSIRWNNKLLSELSKLDNNQGLEVLYRCGADCASGSELLEGAIKVAKKLGPGAETDLLFHTYKTEFYNTPMLSKVGNKVTLVFKDCTCPIVKEGVRNSYLCNCTVGYTKKVFETLFNSRVKVELAKSILQGDKICKQIIHLEK